MRSLVALLKGILIGWLVGAGVALVYAPRRGDETRALIRDRSLELRDQAVSKVEETRWRAEELAQRGQEKVSEQKVVLESAVEGIKEGVRTFKERDPLAQDNEDLPVPMEQARVDLTPGITTEEPRA
jgi:gas vesicle protein